MSDIKIDKIVYFVRHGQSEDNVAPVYQSPNSPLSKAGRQQASLIAERVSKLSFETLLSSPYQRAKETAETITKITSKEPEFFELFKERVKPTSINGKAYTDKKADATWREWEKSVYTTGMRVEDGENFNDLVVRADRALVFLKNRVEKSMVVVTHGYFLSTIVARVILSQVLSGEAFKQFQKMVSMENTGITVLRYQAGFEEDSCWRLWIYNDHAHLAE